MSASTPSARARAWEWIQAVLLAANLAWTTLGLGGYFATTMVTSCVLTGALLVAHCLARATDRAGEESPRVHPAGWWLLPFLVYAAINVRWITPVRWLGWQDWYKWAQLVATFWVVLNGIRSRGPRTLLVATLGALALTGVAMACYQRFVRPDWMMLGCTPLPSLVGRSSGSFKNPNTFAALLILLLPAGGALCLRPAASATQRVFFGWLTAVLAFGLLLTISRGAGLALAIALVMWPVVASRGSWRRRAAWGLGALALVILAGALVYQLSPKSRSRMQAMVRQSGELYRPRMWQAAWKIFVAHPVVGGGAGSFNIRYEAYRAEDDQLATLWAHNDYLNTLSDYGAIGGILFFGAAGAIAWQTLLYRAAAAPSKREPGLRHALDDPLVMQGCAVGLLAFSFQLLVEFHFKIPALGLAFATLAGLTVARRWTIPSRPQIAPRVRFANGAAAVLAGCVALFWFLPAFRAEGLREAGWLELNHLTGDLPSLQKKETAERALALFARATGLDPANSQAWADRAYALAMISHEDSSHEKELGRDAETFARRALADGAIVPEFWLRLGAALDMQHRWLDAGGAFTAALKLAPVNAQVWFCQAYHWSLNATTLRLAEAAVATCLRLDPSLREGDTLRRKLAAGR